MDEKVAASNSSRYSELVFQDGPDGMRNSSGNFASEVTLSRRVVSFSIIQRARSRLCSPEAGFLSNSPSLADPFASTLLGDGVA